MSDVVSASATAASSSVTTGTTRPFATHRFTTMADGDPSAAAAAAEAAADLEQDLFLRTLQDSRFSFTFDNSETVADVTARILDMAPLYLESNITAVSSVLPTSKVTLFVGSAPLDPTKTMGSYNFKPLDGELDIRLELTSSVQRVSNRALERFVQESCSTVRAIATRLECEIPE